MSKYIALLRGINLGNRNKILMADLRELFKNLGFSNIRTYIQTGNVAFSSNKVENINELSTRIEKKLFSVYGFEVPIIIRTGKELEDIIENNPFIENGIANVERLHLTFLENTPQKEELEEIKRFSDISKPDEFKIVDRTVYVYCSKRYMDTKLGNNFFEKKLKVRASTRTWKTALKIYKLAMEKN